MQETEEMEEGREEEEEEDREEEEEEVCAMGKGGGFVKRCCPQTAKKGQAEGGQGRRACRPAREERARDFLCLRCREVWMWRSW
jgi:hypothetical protein